MNTAARIQTEILDDLLGFVRRHGAPCMEQWPDRSVREYLRFHGNQGTLVVAMAGDQVVGLSVVWLAREQEMERFWEPNDPTANCAYVAHWIARDRQASREMSIEWRRRVPQWASLNVWMRRAGKGLVRVPVQLWEKFVK